MATPADQRLLELLDKWLMSLELHTKYSSLDDDSYWKIQPWARHQRPGRWILDLAKQKTIALQNQVHERIKMGDAQFADALELMAFLTNLVGSEHIERFIPIADAQSERPPASAAAVPADAATATATREMPQFPSSKRLPLPAGTDQVARSERKAPAAPKPASRAMPKPAKSPSRTNPPAAAKPAVQTSAKPGAAESARELVIADAARLLQWGRKWYELAELIARMADRPPLADVQSILKDNKAAIERKSGGA